MQGVGLRRKPIAFVHHEWRGDGQWRATAFLRTHKRPFRIAVLTRLNGHQTYRRPRVERRKYVSKIIRPVDHDQEAAACQ